MKRQENSVTLRALVRADIPQLLKWRNDFEVCGFLACDPPYSETEEEEWFEGLGKDRHQNRVFGIEALGGTLIGTVGLHRINARDQTSWLGIAIGEKEFWGKGYGTDAMMCILHYGFNSLNLRKITLSVLGTNKRARQCYQSCGFTEAGVLKKQLYRNGRYVDEFFMEVFRKEWASLWKKYSS